jgi:hypothetical protein
VTPVRQLWHLVGLRWSMTSRAARAGSLVAVVVVVALGPLLAVAAAGTAERLPPDVRSQSTEVLAGAYLLLLVGLVTAAVASAGGREVVPRGQLVAYPLAASTEHLGALLLAPLNLAWLIQVLGLTLLTGAGVGVTATTVPGATLADGSLSPAATGAVLLAVGVAWAWAVVATAAAQVLAWAVEIVRTLPGGRWWLRGAMAATAVWGLLVVDRALLVRVLDRTPTALVSDRALETVSGGGPAAALTVLVLLVLAAGLVALGALVHAALTRRPSRDQARQETHRHKPHELPAPDAAGAEVRAWRRADWAGVWRSPPLRRGLVVLVVAPVAGGLLARVGLTDVVLITAVVASGAGLLFGVNAFCLDGEGAVWRESLPVPARTWLLSRGWVLTEVVLLTAVAATVAAASQAVGRASASAVTAMVVALVAMSGQVVARCLRWSTTSPHRAELRTTRDSPAPPGRMASYSAQLVLATTALGIALSIAARLPSPAWAVLVALPSLALTARSLVRTAARWERHEVRAAVVQAISRG